MYPIIYCYLALTACLSLGAWYEARQIETKILAKNIPSMRYRRLRQRYFTAFLAALFASWLQRTADLMFAYRNEFTAISVTFLNVASLASSMLFGTFVNVSSDFVGRKRVCLMFGIVHGFCFVLKSSGYYDVSMLGYVCEGVASSILYTTFETWYVHEHVRANLPDNWLSLTVAKTKFYSALIGAASVSVNYSLDCHGYGYQTSCFVGLALLMLSDYAISKTWDENDLHFRKQTRSLFEALTQLSGCVWRLGAVQVLFETVFFVFSFTMSPSVAPITRRTIMVFFCYTMCYMTGTSLFVILNQRVSAEKVLQLSSAVCLASFVAYLTLHRTEAGSGCSFAYGVYEISVGLHYAAIGYLKSRALPEEIRGCLSAYFRLPTLLFSCVLVVYVKMYAARARVMSLWHSREYEDAASYGLSYFVYVYCVGGLALAVVIGNGIDVTQAESMEGVYKRAKKDSSRSEPEQLDII